MQQRVQISNVFVDAKRIKSWM